MKQSKYLFKRGKVYYFRFSNCIQEIRLSLQTTDYYEACFLKDKIRENLKGYMMSDDNPFKIKNSKLIRENAKKALEREKNRNSGTLCTAFFFSTI